MPQETDHLLPLPPSRLRRRFDPRKVPFTTSDQADCPLEPVVGQARAKQALAFGLAMRDMDYHLFVDGPQHTGKTHLVRSFVERIAAELPPPDDWVYVHNFRQPDRPKALAFPPGEGRVFAREMERLVEDLKRRIPEAFEAEDYAKRKEALTNRFKHQRSEVFSRLDRWVREQGYVLRFEPTGIVVAPADEDGKPLPEDRIREMSEDERAALRERSDRVQAQVTEALRQVNAYEKELETAQKELERQVVRSVVDDLLQGLLERYGHMTKVRAYLEAVREDVVEHHERFRKKEQPQLPFPVPSEQPSFREYRVNLFVDNSETTGAPVVVESNPTFPNLFGRIERQAQFGALVTDFTLLKAGSLHQANGGFLVIPALELLKFWLPWDGLKRALRERRAFMEDPAEQLGFLVTRSLKPEPIPLNLKVILVGPSYVYHLLYAYDPQFPKLFKVRAQMAGRMDWGGSEVEEFIAYLCGLVERYDLMPLHRGAVARLVELAAELAGDQKRLTLQLAAVEDVVRESDYQARQAGHQAIMAADVEKAIAARRRRASMLEERLREAILRGFIRVETEGSRVGQVNGLSVIHLGDHVFGTPNRITASLGVGKEGVIAIDRESKLSGPIHTKGVLILAGFLRERFAGRGPLTLSAGLAFEQSYSTIDGDSASLAEALALISRLSGVPLRQDLAVTGAISQQGQVQAVGGVNQKIEGFFRLCQARGLTGSQGVVIPRANLESLMLHPDIVAACRRGRFAVYAVDTVEQAVELLTGKKAGQLSRAGNYPRGSVYYLVQKELERLRELAAGKKKRAKKK